MKLQDLLTYIEELGENLMEITPKIKRDEDTGGFYVTITSEKFIYEDEHGADEKIDEVRRNPGFASSSKAYKAGKMNKAGEVTKPETYVVKVKINQ